MAPTDSNLLSSTHLPTRSAAPPAPPRRSPMSMLKLWPIHSLDQTTPKASAQDRNPFDDPSLVSSTTISAQNIRQSNGHTPRTPTGAAFQHHHLLHPGSTTASVTFANGLASPVNEAGAAISSPINCDATTPGPSASKPVTSPTTQISLHAPVFHMQQPPQGRSLKPNATSAHKKSQLSLSSSSNKSSTASSASSSAATAVNSASSSKGQLHLKLLSARSLNVSSHSSRPYVVVQYDNNEFVSREPIAESEKEVKSAALSIGAPSASTNGGPAVMSRNSSTTALSALGAISISSAKKGTARGPNSLNSSPSSSVGSAGSTLAKPAIALGQNREHLSNGSSTKPSSFLGGSGISPVNPVWKHQVSL